MDFHLVVHRPLRIVKLLHLSSATQRRSKGTSETRRAYALEIIQLYAHVSLRGLEVGYCWVTVEEQPTRLQDTHSSSPTRTSNIVEQQRSLLQKLAPSLQHLANLILLRVRDLSMR